MWLMLALVSFAVECGSANVSSVSFCTDLLFRYEPFDFHKECRKMQWHRLSVLTDRVAEDLKSFGLTHLVFVFSICLVMDFFCISCFAYSSVFFSPEAKFIYLTLTGKS